MYALRSIPMFEPYQSADCLNARSHVYYDFKNEALYVVVFHVVREVRIPWQVEGENGLRDVTGCIGFGLHCQVTFT